MFIAAVAHFFAFSHKPFIDRTVDDPNCCNSFLSMWDVSDVKDDVIEHVKVVGEFRKNLKNSGTQKCCNYRSDPNFQTDRSGQIV